MRVRLRSLPVRIVLPVVLLVLWELATGGIVPAFAPLDPSLVGRPDLIVRDFLALIGSGEVLPHLVTTLSEAVLGLALSIVGGTVLGVVLGSARLASDAALPYMNVLNSIPRLALAPFFVIWFGIGIASKVLISATTAFFPVFYTTYQGMQSIDRELVNALSIMGAGRWDLLRLVVLPSVGSWVLAGIRTSLGLAIVGAVVGEYLGATEGLGYLLTSAQGALETNRSWAILVVLAIIGVALDAISRLVERRVLAWRTPSVVIE